MGLASNSLSYSHCEGTEKHRRGVGLARQWAAFSLTVRSTQSTLRNIQRRRGVDVRATASHSHQGGIQGLPGSSTPRPSSHSHRQAMISTEEVRLIRRQFIWTHSIRLLHKENHLYCIIIILVYSLLHHCVAPLNRPF